MRTQVGDAYWGPVRFAQALLLAAAVLTLGLVTVGFPALLFSAALLGGLALWCAMGLAAPSDRERVLLPYLATVTIFVIHVGEEYLGRIEIVLSTISGKLVTQREFLLFAAFFAPTFWLAGALLILRRSPLGRYVLATFYFGMIAGEASHFAFAFLMDGTFHYAAGMVTAGPLIASACYGLSVAWRDARGIRAGAGRTEAIAPEREGSRE